MIFHTANCLDTTTETVDMNGRTLKEVSVNLLACRMTSALVVFGTGNLPTPTAKPVSPAYTEEEQCRLYYYNFPLPVDSDAGEADQRIRHQWALSAISFEFSTLSPNHSMSEARYIYGCSTADGSYSVALGRAAKLDCLVKVDVRTLIARGVKAPPRPIRGCVDTRAAAEIIASSDPDDPIRVFQMPRGSFAQEPRFVPRHESERQTEDDGWLLTYVFDEGQLNEDGACGVDAVSELWIINARTMGEVVAKVKLPQRVPYGLHGAWFSEREVRGQRPFTVLRTVEDEGESSFSRGLRTMAEPWVG